MTGNEVLQNLDGPKENIIFRFNNSQRSKRPTKIIKKGKGKRGRERK
jgi:hypothetical protein